MGRRALLLSMLGMAAALGAARPAVAADQSLALPPYTAAYEPQSVDERGLWMQADEVERRLRDSPLRIREGKLESYLHDVLCRQVGADRCAGIRIYAMEIPSFNATMMPNGAMQVWSGLLLRARNEAELASVLGHEFAHFELRHGLNGFKNRRGTSDAIAWIGVLGGVTATPVDAVSLLLAGTTFRFSREQETEADLLGLKYMAGSGYPAGAAVHVWQSLVAEEEATAAGRKQKARTKRRPGFADTHPAPPQRIAYLTEAASRLPAEGDTRADAYQAAIAPYLSRFLSAQVKLNDFGGTDYILSNLAQRAGWTGELTFARAELYRARANPRDL